ncbi:MAG: metalloregulator ArsR/SmtB family transcription factor [Chloroflexi bacterium]|nr:metalloregulator ArsR/SmtB family transcription factor [Chloroflexota bacterium]
MSVTERIARVFHALGQPERLKIMAALGAGEACVCHLEAALGYRQAYLSQQLMALREAGLAEARREGRFIYYRLADPGALDLIWKAGEALGMDAAELSALQATGKLPGCSCPRCEPGGEPRCVVAPAAGALAEAGE